MKDIIKIYLNANVRAGIDKGDVKGLAAFVKGRFATKIASLKTPKAQERVKEILKDKTWRISKRLAVGLIESSPHTTTLPKPKVLS